MSKINRVALLGTGLMGYPMARNLAQAGFDVAVWNRSAEKATGLSAFGATICDTPANAVSGADVVITMLSDGAAVAQVAADRDLRAQLSRGAVWVDMSSTKPEEARQLEQDLSPIGIGFLDAPVSGGSRGAEEATLAIMVGGTAENLAKAEPVLRAMGRPTRVGPVGAGQLAKLANQAIVAVSIAAVAEAMLILEQGGADPAAVRAALKGGFADSTILQQHGERMTERNFVPGGLSRLQVKDLDNVLAEAGTLELPTVSHVRDRFAHYVTAMNGGERDHSGLFEELLARNGMAS